MVRVAGMVWVDRVVRVVRWLRWLWWLGWLVGVVNTKKFFNAKQFWIVLWSSTPAATFFFPAASIWSNFSFINLISEPLTFWPLWGSRLKLLGKWRWCYALPVQLIVNHPVCATRRRFSEIRNVVWRFDSGIVFKCQNILWTREIHISSWINCDLC